MPSTRAVAGPVLLTLAAIAAAEASLELRQSPTGGAAEAPPVIGGGRAFARFRLDVRVACDGGAARRLLVSVADTAVEMDAPSGAESVVIDVPAPQLAGVRRTQQCPGPGLHRLTGRVTAYATAVCNDGSSAAISAPLDLWLDCPAPPGDVETPR